MENLEESLDPPKRSFWDKLLGRKPTESEDTSDYQLTDAEYKEVEDEIDRYY